jgi:type II secretory pathway predicted ATPase ExeA
VKHPAQVDERDRIQRAATQRMTSRGYTYRAGQRPAEMLQSVACLVGAGKTVAARAAVARLDASRYQLITIPNPQVGARGIHHAVVTALGGVPRVHHATLIPQAAGHLAAELAERGRLPVLLIDEAHLLSHDQLEAIRMLTNTQLDSASPLAVLLLGQPQLRASMRLGVLAALDQRIAVRYQMTPMTSQETTGYLIHHTRLAGRSDTLFSDVIRGSLGTVWCGG